MSKQHIKRRFMFHFRRNSTTSRKVSGMLLSLCSPVLRKTICGGFIEGRAKRLELDDVDAGRFGSLLDAWCGRTGLEAKELGDLMALAGLADRFEMTEVQGGLEEAIIGRLSVGTCADVLTRSGGLGLRRVEAAAESGGGGGEDGGGAVRGGGGDGGVHGAGGGGAWEGAGG